MKKMNNKGFSLIELIIVIAIMAILVAIIAPNLTKYLGKSKKNTDKKNADEIASNIQTAITNYNLDNDTLLSSVTLTWGANGKVSTGNTAFDAEVNQTVGKVTKAKETGKMPSGSINYNEDDDSYTIEVTVGNTTVNK
jgi:type IV pilus assembly protein PilA